MRSAYFKELDKLSFEEIKNRLDANDDEIRELIESLKYNNKKIVKSYLDDGEEDEELDESESDKYSFNFVGIIMYKNFIIKCYPKYINDNYSDLEKDDMLKIIVQVLKKYGKSEKGIVGMSTENQDKDINLISIISFIITDFVDNGLYSNQKEIYEVNGEEEIDWDKTVNDTTAFLVDKRPFYFDMITRNDINNEIDFFRQMHKYVITQCSKILKKTGLANILSLPVVEFEVDEALFSDEEYVLNRIIKELNIQFISRKQIVLKTLYSYFSNKQEYSNHTNMSLFGTMSFNFVWEKTCAFVLNNQLNNRIDKINGIDKQRLGALLGKKKLSELIPFPYWIPKDAKNSKEYKKTKKTIQLDLISIFKRDSKRYFIIWDAKYYNLILNTKDKLKYNPGVEDVIKQYVYYLVYADFIKNQNFDYSYNVLLFPSEECDIKVIGKVDFEILRKALNIEKILVMKMPANLIFGMYLKEEILNIGEKIDFNI
ncbi:LlaJI family restriction endonuclease [Clostridium sp. L74]|uniref:LlaJI family restriction endonuclease n=1 Tax=Clostridium sp. L74 TaxID=1560217 RepID=UPI0006ABB2E2|nr:LlaJI family restriction endonuclease [Clostridium sp. L74]KOR25153.1 hypothetical protein ND00_18460 [Clostridium sp. L74]